MRVPFLFLFALTILAASSCSARLPVDAGSGINAKVSSPVQPVIRGMNNNVLFRISVYVPEGESKRTLKSLSLKLDAAATGDLDSLRILNTGSDPLFTTNGKTTSAKVSGTLMEMALDVPLTTGFNYLWCTGKLNESANLDGMLELAPLKLADEKGASIALDMKGISFAKRKAVAIRRAGDEGIHTFRIPGITQTDKGTLIAVYDIRYKNSADLPGNVDVGMNRSTDGGQTWEPMKIIMDMGEPHENNGVGDPAILFDPQTRKIWVAALWSKGNRSIAGSQPGLSPDETGQFVVVESSDDGLSWSQPFSITPQVKDPAWKLFFQGPGNGMAMSDGKIVFAAQYWDASHMPYSTIVYSEDHGQTWKRGTGAKSNTTEAQVVETSPGRLMLSMRDNRGRFRSVATTTDMGKTWVEHPTSYNTLPDPVCMAGFMKIPVNWKGSRKDIVFFSNPAASNGRYNMTVKASADLAETWPGTHQLLVDERNTYGYSVMTRIDDNTIGLLYEGIRDLYFMRIPVKDISK